MRVVFMGTPDIAVPSLQALLDAPDVEVSLVVSQPDRPVGRGRKLTSPPVAALAKAAGVPVFQPESLKTDEAYARLAAEAADLFIVVAYGQILRQRVLDLPKVDCINVHASLLPRWRGAGPIQWAIRAGDAVTGVSIMRMERSLDTGPVFAMAPLMIGETETASELHDRLATIGAALLVDTLPAIMDRRTPTPQPHGRSSYARMLNKADREIPFGLSAREVADHINGMTSWPGAVATLDGTRLTFTRARATQTPTDASAGTVVAASGDDGLLVACGDQRCVEVLEVKRPGKRAMEARAMLRGYAIAPGSVLA